MNNSYNYADFAGISLSSNNELEHSRPQPELQQVSSYSSESSADRHIEDMLLSHSRYYVYCE